MFAVAAAAITAANTGIIWLSCLGLCLGLAIWTRFAARL